MNYSSQKSNLNRRREPNSTRIVHELQIEVITTKFSKLNSVMIIEIGIKNNIEN
jgi:hypothetical protein